jgi:hypothetical protein
MDYMQLYKDFSHLWSPLASSDNIVPQEMLVKDEHYIWEQNSVILLRFVSHHSKYAIQAKIVIYKGVMQPENDIPQILTTSGGIFYRLIKTAILVDTISSSS